MVLVDRLGRKTILLSTGPISLASWLLVWLTRSLPVLYLVRLLQGAAVAVVYTIAPMYIAEISEPRIRGALSGQFQTAWYVGVLFCYVTGPFLSYNQYALICTLGPLLFTIIFYMMPESPYFLLMVQREKDAANALCWLRNSDQIETEFTNIRQSVQDDMKLKGGWRDLIRTKKDRKAFFIVQTVCLIKYLNGMPAIVTYATQTFAQSSNGAIKDYQLTITLGVLLCITTFFAAFMSDSVGRRTLLLFSTFASAIFNIITGLYYFLLKSGVDVSDYYWLMFTSVAGFCCISNIGLGPLMQTIQAEFFPSHTRGIGSGITEVTASIGTFINLKQYQTVEDLTGVYMNFWIFAVVGLTGTLIMYFVIPETAGKSLGEIQKDFKTSKKDKALSNGISLGKLESGLGNSTEQTKL